MLAPVLAARPNRVMNVDYKSMLVQDRDVLVRMMVRLGALPSFMIMLVVFSVNV